MNRQWPLLAGSVGLFVGLLAAAVESRPSADSTDLLPEQVAALEMIAKSFPEKGKPPRKFLHFGILGLDQRPAPNLSPDLQRRLRAVAKTLGVNTLPDAEQPTRNLFAYLREPFSPGNEEATISRDLTGWIRGPDRLRAVGALARYLPPTELKASDLQRILSRKGYRAEELGLKSLADAQPEDRDRNSKLYYPTQLLKWEMMAAKPMPVVDKLFGAGVQVGAQPTEGEDRFFYSRALLPFRLGWQSLPWQVDRSVELPEVSPQAAGFNWAVARSAGRYQDQPFLASIPVDSRVQTPESLRRAYYLALGHGAKMFRFDGAILPAQAAKGERSVNPEDARLWLTLHDLIHETGAIEELAFANPPRPAGIAFLISSAEEVRGHPESVAEELKALYVCCRQAGYAVDVLTEDDVQRGRADKYVSIFFVGSHLERRTAEALKQWVHNGGALASYAGGGLLDEHGQPLPVLLEVYGIAEAKLEHPGKLTRAKIDLPKQQPLDTLTFNFEGVKKKLPVVAARQTLKPAGNPEVFAHYSDGSVAGVRNKYGKGIAFLYGTYAGSSWCRTALPHRSWKASNDSAGLNHFVPLDFDHDLGDQVSAGSDQAVFHVVTDNLAVETVLLEGPKGIAVVCINWSNTPQRIFLTVQQPSPDFTKATSLEKGPLKVDKIRDFRNPRSVTYNFKLQVNVTDVILIE